MRISRIADLGGSVPAGKSVDINLSAIRSGRRTGQRRQLIRQLIGIVGERVEVLAFQHDRAGIGAGFGAYRRRPFIRDHDLLLGGFNRHLDVDILDLPAASWIGVETKGAKPWKLAWIT